MTTIKAETLSSEELLILEQMSLYVASKIADYCSLWPWQYKKKQFLASELRALSQKLHRTIQVYEAIEIKENTLKKALKSILIQYAKEELQLIEDLNLQGINYDKKYLENLF